MFVLLYLLSVLFSYYSFRRLLIVKGWDADGVLTFVVFIPFMNVLWGIFAIVDSMELGSKFKVNFNFNFNKFFRIKRNG